MEYQSQTPSSPPAGWYPNAQGQMQWWDGQQWGPLAPPTAPPQSHQVQTAVPYAQYHQPIGGVKPKSVGVAYVLLIFLGGLGIHRFYLGNVWHGLAFLGLQIAYWVTDFSNLPLIAIWVLFIIDLFILKRDVDKYNGLR